MDDSAEHLQNHADETEAALAAAQKILRTAGIVEIAARNPQVMEYMQHWETRAEKAEAERDALREALVKADDLARAVDALHNSTGLSSLALTQGLAAYRKARGGDT